MIGPTTKIKVYLSNLRVVLREATSEIRYRFIKDRDGSKRVVAIPTSWHQVGRRSTHALPIRWLP